MDSKSLKVGFLFVASYVLLFVLSNVLSQPLGVRAWVLNADIWKLDYMIWFVPVAGFFFIYSIIPFLRTELGFGKNFIYVFPLIFAVSSFFAYQLAVWWYYANQLFLATGGQGIAGTGAGCAWFLCIDVAPYGLNYMQLFLGSHFLYFVLAGILGWAARILLEYFDGAK